MNKRVDVSSIAKAGVILLVAMFVLSACGGNQDGNAQNGAAQNGNTQSAADAQQTQAPTETERTITDATGEKTIPADPQRVAASSQQLIEYLIPLKLNVKIAPKAMPTADFYSYFPKEEYPDIQLVGESSPLNFEAFLAQKPDLIFIREDTQAYEKMSKIAPTIMIKETKDWRKDLTQYAALVGKEKEAEAYLSDYQSQVDQYKEQLKTAVGNQTVVFIRLLDKQVRIYNNLPTSVGGVLYHDLGLTPVEGIESEDLFAAISLEKLLEMNPDHIFVQTGKQDEKPEVSKKRLDDITKGDVWKSLNAFKNNHVYIVDADFFNNTPLSQLNTAKTVVEKLSGQK